MLRGLLSGVAIISSLFGTLAPAEASAQGGLAAQGSAAAQGFRDCADCPEMLRIAPGSYVRGSTAAETTREKTP